MVFFKELLINAGGAFALLAIAGIVLNIGANIYYQVQWRDTIDVLYKSFLSRLAITGVYLLCIGTLLIFITIYSPVWSSSLRATHNGLLHVLAATLDTDLFLILTMLATAIFGKSAFQALRWRARTFVELLLGVLWCAMMISTITLIMHGFHWQQVDWLGWTRIPDPLGFGVALLFDVLATELIFRGYLVRQYTATVSSIKAALLSSLFWTLPFFLVPHLTWFNLIFIFLAGLFLCRLSWMSNSLWLPIAFRLTWSFILKPPLILPSILQAFHELALPSGYWNALKNIVAPRSVGWDILVSGISMFLIGGIMSWYLVHYVDTNETSV